MSEEKKNKCKIGRIDPEKVSYVIAFKKSRPQKEDVAERGQIMGLTIKNFMNYDHLEIPFNRNINIFNSDDLSVKTTICDALFIGLNGDEYRHGLHANVKDYVKNKDLPATILVTLWNNNKPPYNCDLIHVQCVIKAAKYCTRMYTLMNNNGNTITSDMNARRLLEEVKWNMRIMLQQPAIMMTQKDSTNFLFNTKRDTMYQVFMSGSSIDPSETYDYPVTSLEFQIDKKRKHANSLIARSQEAKKKKESTAADRKKLEDLKKQLGLVRILELKKEEGKCMKLKEELIATQNQEQEIEMKIGKSIDELQKCEAVTERKRKEFLKAQSSRAANKQKELIYFKERLDLQNKMNKMKVVQYTSELEVLKENMEQIERHIQQNRDEMTRKEDQLQQMRDNRMTIYGCNMPILLNDIEEAMKLNKFRRQPLGPLGSCINLKDPNWADVVEDHIGKDMLRALYVDNIQDYKTLEVMINQYSWERGKPKIMNKPFSDKTFDLRHEDGYENLLDMLGITDAIVARYFKDHKRVFDRVFLKNTTQTDVVIRPRHCIRVLNKHGVTIYGHSKPRTHPLSEAEFLNPIESHIEYRELKNHLQSMMERRDSLNKKLGRDLSTIEQKKTDLEQTKKSIEAYELNRRNMSDSMDTVDANDDINLEPGTSEENIAEIEKLKRKIDETKSKESDLTMKLDQITLVRLLCETTMDANLVVWPNDDREKIKKSIADEENKLPGVREALKSKEHKLQEAQTVVKNLKADIKKQNFTVDSVVLDATDMNPQRSSAEIDQEMKQLEEKIASDEKQQDIDADSEALMEQYQKAMESISDFRVARSSTQTVQNDANNCMIKEACDTMKQEFGRLVDRAKLENNLIINSKEGELGIGKISPCAEKRITKKSDLRDPQNLYYIMAFVTAFQKCMNSPFFIIDKFEFPRGSDIEKVATENVLEHLKTYSYRQFIVFNHLEKLHSISEDRITYHKLPLPQPTAGTSSQSD